MPKIKTNRAAAKRFKKTGTGKLKRNKAYKSHILTKKTAKRKRNLSVDDFIKKSSIISFSREALEPMSQDIQKFAKAEGLTAHANSIKVRFDD